MNQRTADDRDNEERLKYLQAQIQSLGLMQAQQFPVTTPWPQYQQNTGRQSVSPEHSLKLPKRASFYDKDRIQDAKLESRNSMARNDAQLGQASGEQSKRASFYQKPALSNIDDSLDEASNFETRARTSHYQQESNELRPKQESVAAPHLTSAMKKPTQYQSQIPVGSPKRQAEENFKPHAASHSPSEFSKPNLAKLIVGI